MSETDKILNSLKTIKGIHGAAVLEKFGLITGTSLPGWVDPESVAAMVTLILKASERATKELNQGEFTNAIIENERGKILFSSMGDKIIVVLTTVDVKLGILNLKLNAAKAKLSN